MGEPRWNGSDWEFDVYVCPVCHAQVEPEGDEYSVDCFDHAELVTAQRITVRANAGDVLRELGQTAEQDPPPGA